MVKIIRPRGTGKTKELMLEAAKYYNNLFVCKDARHMQEKALAYGIYNLNFINYLDFWANYIIRGTYGDQQVLFIDDIDEFLPYLFREFSIGGFDITYEEE